MEVAGVDGCPKGWLVVWADAGTFLRLLSVRVGPDFADVLQRTNQCAAVGIDIPIGLSDDGRRRPDVEARKVLSPLRHNSVFPAPIRPVLAATSYREACDISAKAHSEGKKISKQTYFMTLRIRDVDHHIDAAVQNRVVEVHPEVCFWALNGRRPLDHYKRTCEGEGERLALLSAVFADDLAATELPIGAGRDDLLDACAAAWTAARYARGEHGTLPDDPQVDARGLRMEMVY
jgi:predicted RNase H-like nuclease